MYIQYLLSWALWQYVKGMKTEIDFRWGISEQGSWQRN